MINNQMLDSELVINENHKKFIKTICETKVVYGLESNDGFATSCSNTYEDDEGEPIELICFWSDKASAQSCIANEWSNYTISEIPLSEFIENWCLGMDGDGLLVGTNFDLDLFGQESDPLELILDLIAELKITKTELEFVKFNYLQDLENQVKDILL